MATKDDIAALTRQLTSVERELKAIRRELDDLKEKVENEQCLQLAEQARSPEMKASLLRMAQHWYELALNAERTAKPPDDDEDSG